MKNANDGVGFWLMVCCVLVCMLAWSVPCTADDHGKGRGLLEKHAQRAGRDGPGWNVGKGHDEGNETTGQIAAWSLAFANLTVVLSLAIRGSKRFLPLKPEVGDSLTRFNRLQKRYLMGFHYFLNPIILGIALLHWSLSCCRSTSLPEWGLLTMGAVVLLGMALKFKLCPRDRMKSLYKLHTQPVLLLLLVSFLVVGHFIVD